MVLINNLVLTYFVHCKTGYIGKLLILTKLANYTILVKICQQQPQINRSQCLAFHKLVKYNSHQNIWFYCIIC
jgi:hypothetical protein